MKDINRKAVLVQRMVEGRAIQKRVNHETDEKEYLLEWVGTAGDVHQAWYSERFIKLED